MHPEVLARLRVEILSPLGTDHTPVYDDIREMKYLRAVINETLRLFPPVPFNNRQIIKSTTWMTDDGRKLYIPAGSRVPYSVLLMQRHPDYWGPDSLVFDPDRWLDERLKQYLIPNPFIFLPFNAGPRICLGQQFAYFETSYFLVRMLQKYDHIELAPECQHPDTLPPARWKHDLTGRKAIEQCFPKSHLTLYCEGGLWVRMREAGVS